MMRYVSFRSLPVGGEIASLNVGCGQHVAPSLWVGTILEYCQCHRPGVVRLMRWFSRGGLAMNDVAS